MNIEDIILKDKHYSNKTRESKKIYEEVFDNRTVDSISKLISKGVFNKIDSIISTGKEGNVFKAVREDNLVALKIYRIETSSFDNMKKYIKDDPRFSKIKNNKQSLIYEWTKKEFKNLTLANKNKVTVPFPIDYRNNVLAMQFLGEENAQKTIKYNNNLNIEDVYNQTIENLKNLVYGAKLVHADLSEYNMIYFNDKLYFIDLGQAVSLSHPMAKEFYERDLLNISTYFNRFGLDTNLQDLKKIIKGD